MPLAALLLACVAQTEPTTRSDPNESPVVTDTATDLDAWVAEAEGAWVGVADPTPVGAMPFALDFAWEGEDALAATASGYGTSLTFRYHREDGGWRLTESGSLPGGLTQTHTLRPGAVEDGRVEWIYEADPEYLRVVERHDDDLVLEAWVRGELHAAIRLERR